MRSELDVLLDDLDKDHAALLERAKQEKEAAAIARPVELGSRRQRLRRDNTTTESSADAASALLADPDGLPTPTGPDAVDTTYD